MTFFLALKTEEASSTVANPQLCGPGRKRAPERRQALVSSWAQGLIHQPAFCVSPALRLELEHKTEFLYPMEIDF